MTATGAQQDGRVPSSEDRLAGLLRGPEPPGVTALGGSDRDALADAIEQALERQRRELAASFDATLRHVPVPLRGVVRRVLFG
jgi:hypothetical protein